MCISLTLQLKCPIFVIIRSLNANFWIARITVNLDETGSVALRGKVKQGSETRFSTLENQKNNKSRLSVVNIHVFSSKNVRTKSNEFVEVT